MQILGIGLNILVPFILENLSKFDLSFNVKYAFGALGYERVKFYLGMKSENQLRLLKIKVAP
jgi:hypothetical protein